MTAVNKIFVLLISGILLCTATALPAYEEEEMCRDMRNRGVGIHLGTTHSSVAVHTHPFPIPPGNDCRPWKSECRELLHSDLIQLVTNKTIPSCVAFTDTGILIGQPAKDQEAANPQRTICGIIRLMAKRFNDPDVQSYIKTLPYKVVNVENKPYVEVKLKNRITKVFSPEEICAMILGKMKEIAEAFMGNKIEQTCILVHQSYFSKELRQSIQIAGKMARLKDVFALPSDLAAALANREWKREEIRVLVYHLGANGFRVSLADEGTGAFDVVAARNDIHLGGQTFDARLVDHFINLIKTKYRKDVSNDQTALIKLRNECERAKIALSSSDRATIKIDSLSEGIALFEESLTRETFEELNMDLFNRTFELVREVMGEGEVEKTPLYDEVVVVGGNARIPKIQQMLKELFGKKLVLDVIPDAALAFAGTRLCGEFTQKYEYQPVYFVLQPLNVGIETIGGIMTPNVRFGSFFTRGDYNFVTTSHDNQTTIKINVFEGQRPLTKYCHYLGTLELSVPPAPRGVPKIRVLIESSTHWNIRVTAVHLNSKKTKSIFIPVEERFNTFEKFKQAHKEARDFAKEDMLEKSQVMEAIKRMPQAYSMESGLVKVDGFDAYCSMQNTTMGSNTTQVLYKNDSMSFKKIGSRCVLSLDKNVIPFSPSM